MKNQPRPSVPARPMTVVDNAERIDTRAGTAEPIPMRNGYGFPIPAPRWTSSQFIDTQPTPPAEVVGAWVSAEFDEFERLVGGELPARRRLRRRFVFALAVTLAAWLITEAPW